MFSFLLKLNLIMEAASEDFTHFSHSPTPLRLRSPHPTPHTSALGSTPRYSCPTISHNIQHRHHAAARRAPWRDPSPLAPRPPCRSPLTVAKPCHRGLPRPAPVLFERTRRSGGAGRPRGGAGRLASAVFRLGCSPLRRAHAHASVHALPARHAGFAIPPRRLPSPAVAAPAPGGCAKA
jgi:hypothetical protein